MKLILRKKKCVTNFGVDESLYLEYSMTPFQHHTRIILICSNINNALVITVCFIVKYDDAFVKTKTHDQFLCFLNGNIILLLP